MIPTIDKNYINSVLNSLLDYKRSDEDVFKTYLQLVYGVEEKKGFSFRRIKGENKNGTTFDLFTIFKNNTILKFQQKS